MADMQFRDKSTGWKRYSISCADEGTRILIPHDEDLFMKAFLSNYSIRPSCYSCMFKDTNYYSDLTLGDFWNIGNVMPDYDDDKGVSEIIVRTEKGLKALQQLNGLDMHELSKSDAFQWSLYNSVDMPLERNAFFDFLQNHSLEETDERFMSCNRSKWTLKRIVNGVKRRFGFYKEPPFEIRRPSLEHYFIKERSDFSFDVRRSCTGCSACANACPKDAIRMTPDPEGFLYPSIDASLCVDCHICEKVCPVKNLKDRRVTYNTLQQRTWTHRNDWLVPRVGYFLYLPVMFSIEVVSCMVHGSLMMAKQSFIVLSKMNMALLRSGARNICKAK